MVIDKDLCYVYDGLEVRQTGRTAVKTIGKNLRAKEQTIVEITPALDAGLWFKWVRPEDLYVIHPSE
jgi:hypothetical protein